MTKKQCDRCGIWKPDVYITYVGDERWCRSCARAHAVACPQCGVLHPREYTFKVGREYWCATCRAKYAVACEECGNHFAPGDIYATECHALCWDCARNRCSACGETVDRPLRINGQPFCRRCAPV